MRRSDAAPPSDPGAAMPENSQHHFLTCPLCEGKGHVHQQQVQEWMQEFLDSAHLTLNPVSDHDDHDDTIGH